ncbi:hypothetical protein JCM10908_002397 [Rhodotorula pacifica]|uniref:uncharacterized protein n=1 Tax=Rhodotorula pacifica TaxID=1495444 RepID=UPI00317685FB
MAPRSVSATAAQPASSAPSPRRSRTPPRGDPRCPACCHACRQQAQASTSYNNYRPSTAAVDGEQRVAPAPPPLLPPPSLLPFHPVTLEQAQALAAQSQAQGQANDEDDALVAATGAMTIDPRLGALASNGMTPGSMPVPMPAAVQPPHAGAVAPTPPRKPRHHRHGHHHHRHNGGSKPKRPPPAPPADGSAAPPVPPKPVLPPDGSVKTCEAVDRYDELCDEVVVGGWKGKVPRRWCQIHEDEEKHVRSSFWNAVSSLPRLSRTHPLPAPAEITTSTSFTELEAWETVARQHIELAKRAYDAWVFHREHFFAAGGDLVDRLEGRGEGPDGTDLARGAWEEVRLRGEKAEAVLKLIIRRSHFLVCDAEDALWLLHPQRCQHASGNPPPGGGYGSNSSHSSCACSHEHSDCEHDTDCDCSDVDDGGSSACSACGDDAASVTPSSDSHAQHRHHHHHNHGNSSNAHHNPAHPHHQHAPPEKAPHNPLRPPGSPTLAPEGEEPDPLLALETLRRTELLELLSLTGSHASFIREGRKSVERVRIVECLFRRLISRDEELLVKAYRGGHDHVLRFFEDPALVTLPSLARLHRALQRTSPVELKEAIMDAFRAIAWEESGATETEEGEEGVGMQVLGGWVYKNQLERSMTPREWSHLYDLCACPGCATRCCMRFDDLALIRRLTVVPHGPHPPPFELWASEYETDAQKVLKALDVVWCAGKERDDDPKPKRMRQPGAQPGAEPVWTQREERNWAYLKISASHPHALAILSFLSKYFTMVLRSWREHAVWETLRFFPPPAANLWTHRIRSAPTKAALLNAPASNLANGTSGASTPTSSSSSGATPWRALPNPFNLSQRPLQILAGFEALDSPEKEQDMPRFFGTYELLILDAPSDSPYVNVETYLARPLWAFENFLAATIALACGIKVPGATVFEDASTSSPDQIDMPALVQAALEHGAVESFLHGDLVWDFGDVKGVTTPFPANSGKKFAGVDLKKVGKDGIVAPPLPTAAGGANGPTTNGSSGGGGGGGKKKGAKGGALTSNGVKANGGANGAPAAGAAGANGTERQRKERVLDTLRDDKLARKLARSLFR